MGGWVGDLHTKYTDTPGSGAQPGIVGYLSLCVLGPWFSALGHNVGLTRLAHVAWNGLSFCLRY